jgi:hypothetical protein
MDDEPRSYDSNRWRAEPGANTGDARENDRSAPGFTDDSDRVFRSQFQHANRRTHTRGEHVRSDRPREDPAGALKARDSQEVERIETDVENGWLNVRVGDGEWASTPDMPRVDPDPARQGRIEGLPPAGTTPSHDRPSYRDPVPGDTDPIDPRSPETQP